MQSKYGQNDDEILFQNDDDDNGELINFDQFDEDEQDVITPVDKGKQQIQQTFGDQLQVMKDKEDEEQVIEDIVQFKQNEEQDNVANFGSMHRDEDFQSWKDENKQNDQNEQVQQTNQIDAMTERQEQQAQIIYQPGMIIDMKEFLQKPIDQQHLIQLTLVKDKSGTNKFHPKFLLYLSDQQKVFLCSAKRQAFSQQIHYVLSILQDKFDRKHKSCLGKIKGQGGIFKLFDTGDNPKDAKFLDKVRKELCLINFQNSKQTGQLRQSVIIPKIKDGQAYEFKPLNDADGLLKAYYSLQYKDQIMHFMNKNPIYNKEKKKYQLQFNDRVTMPSVKNCIIYDISCTDKNKFVLQFGKCAKKTYSVDICHPLSIIQGFAICISQFEGKH
ncbi:unnamed protein product [Paramecium octaurelia]|uniref:Tubby C-terminal domain-containing protein n=1 Tax=Paramecium octaurelia TaxID=43137 RepID=A0A8S1SKC0_PAROT|nr:unnamed protein product [Paramecium octaurelia]